MPKRKKPEEKPEAQFKRFVETAKELGVDDDGKSAASAFKKLTPKASKYSPHEPAKRSK